MSNILTGGKDIFSIANFKSTYFTYVHLQKPYY